MIKGIYKMNFSTGKLESIACSDPICDKNNLQPGAVLKLEGYDYHKSVIIENLGINPRFSSHGARYRVVNLEDYTQSFKDAYCLESEKKTGIHTWITNEKIEGSELSEIIRMSNIKENKIRELKEKAEIEAAEAIERGKILYKKHVPDDAQAIIIAELVQDETDLSSDYFGCSVLKKVVLGYSHNTRNHLPELRKHAAKFKETSHLVDCASDRQKSTWEHHKILKDGFENNSGWGIYKNKNYNQCNQNDIYYSLGMHCIF
jgi:hypothetical protein